MQVQLPSLITGTSRVSCLKILGVTMKSQLSVSEHVSSVLLRPDRGAEYCDQPICVSVSVRELNIWIR